MKIVQMTVNSTYHIRNSMNEEIEHSIRGNHANAWWNALPDVTKVAIYADLMDILEGQESAG